MEEKKITINDELLVKYLTGMADIDEHEMILQWIHQSEENRKYYDQLRDIYLGSKTSQGKHTYKSDLSWERVKSRYYKKQTRTLQKELKNNQRRTIREVFKYAAVISIFLSLGLLGYRYFFNPSVNDTKKVWHSIEAPFGSRSLVNLADGTRVWLNAGSKLKYSSDFGRVSREVYLDGEAYFDVTQNDNMYFEVKTSHISIKVLGTEFNVKAYHDEDIIQTTLVKGSITIDIITSDGQQEIQLKPNQTSTYFKGQNIIKRNDKNNINRKNSPTSEGRVNKRNITILPKINPIVYTSWKDARWVISGEPLSSLTIKLERRYNVKFVFITESLQNYKFSGTLKDETLEQVLNIICISAPIKYSIKNNYVYLDENRSFRNSYDELLINKE